MKNQPMFYLRLLGGVNLVLTLYRVTTFEWGRGSHHHLSQCLPTDGYHQMAMIVKLLCMMYNTKRSFKVLWGIRSFFTLVLFFKRIQSSKSCYGFWFISTVAELCIKIYLVQNGGMDPPGIIQFFIEIVMVYILTAILASEPQEKIRRRQFIAVRILPV